MIEDERKGSAFFGLPAMIGVLAFVAFWKASNLLVAILGTFLILLVIGAVVTTARRRRGP